VRDNLDVCSGDMGVGFDEVRSEDARKELGRSDRVLFSLYVDCVLHGISGYNHAVICSCVARSSQLGHSSCFGGVNGHTRSLWHLRAGHRLSFL